MSRVPRAAAILFPQAYQVEESMKKLAALSISAFAIATVLAIPAHAAEVITIPVDKIVYGVEGRVYPFETAEVPAEFVGWVCVGEGVTDNNESEHPNNDMIITSGDTSVEIINVESAQGDEPRDRRPSHSR
ncbi:MAG: hypothetical protein R2706_13565 [Acidimicrobiales bacterium]